MLEHGIQAYVDEVNSTLSRMAAPDSAAGHREFRESLMEFFPTRFPAGMTIRNRFIEAPGRQIGIRIYRPAGWQEGGGAALFFHGGGFVSGSVFTHDIYAAGIAETAGLQVISVNYRLAPENPYPAALDDCYFTLEWLAQNGAVMGIDTERMVIGGDSAGGNLAAACTLKARDKDGPVARLQYLIFPCLNTDFDLRSYVENKNDPFLKRSQMMGFWNDYLSGRYELDDYYALPLRCPDYSRLPAAYIVTADHDPLMDEGEIYARKLEAAGVPVQYRCVEGAMHGFLRARYTSKLAAAELEQLGRRIREAVMR